MAESKTNPKVKELIEKKRISEALKLAETMSSSQLTRMLTSIKAKKKKKDEESDCQEYVIEKDIALLIKEGDLITAGQQLTEGHIDLKELFKLKGVDAIQDYVIKEVQQIYTSQGEGIDDKHIEIIIRQMLSRVTVQDSGDTDLLSGDIIEKSQLMRANNKIAKEEKETGKKKQPATATQLLLGITKASLTTESFLSAASFQETARVLINAAVTGKEDHLKGLKENVIIGRLIPAGTGYRNLHPKG